MILVEPVFEQAQHSHPEQMGESGPQVIECELTDDEFEAARQIIQSQWTVVSDFVQGITPPKEVKMRKIELAPPNVIIMDDLNYRKVLESQGLRKDEPTPGVYVAILDGYIAVPRSLLNTPKDFSFKLTKELLGSALYTYESIKKEGESYYRLSNGIIESFEKKDDQSKELYENYIRTLRGHKSRQFPELTNRYMLIDRTDHVAVVHDENMILRNPKPTPILSPAVASTLAIDELTKHLIGRKGSVSQQDARELLSIFLITGRNPEDRAGLINLKLAMISAQRDSWRSRNN